MPKVAIYCRLSEEDKNKSSPLQESESIQNQKAMLTEYAIRQGWDIYNTYCDEDYSGIDANRPEFNKLLRDAEMRRFNIVLCKTQSRFSRDMIMIEHYVHNKFAEWGIRFIALIDHVDTENKGNKKARQINGMINEWFLEDLSDNIKSVLTNKRSRGQYIGSFFPYGYLKDPADKNHLIVDPEASRNVLQIYEWYAGGYGIRTITGMLNSRQILNPANYKMQKYSSYKCVNITKASGGLWNTTTVRDILKNQVYLGHMVQGKCKRVSYKNHKLVHVPRQDWIIVENTHEPIIEKDLFDKAQKRLSSNTHPEKPDGKVSALAGKLRCMHCGSILNKSCGKKYPYMRCRKKEQYKGGCPGTNIRCSWIENIVLENIRALFEQNNTGEYLRISLKENQRTEKRLLDLELRHKAVEREIGEISDAAMNLYLDKTRGIISETQFRNLNNALLEKEGGLEKQLSSLNQAIEYEAIRNRKGGSLADIHAKYTTVHELKRDMVEELIDYIEIGGKEDTREKVVSIHWKF